MPEPLLRGELCTPVWLCKSKTNDPAVCGNYLEKTLHSALLSCTNKLQTKEIQHLYATFIYNDGMPAAPLCTRPRA